ncbi:MAG: chloride channel protein [Scytonema sp. PMC 1069.18]|nr:chloride channel protein [Scytonema sp. PMC 1069.18]MEC4881952.1 chloride channel protein [Scytonema sp. PMC 1070.18]
MSPPFLNQGLVRAVWQPRRGLAIAEASVIGIVAALSAVFFKFGVGWLGTWRIRASLLFPAWIVLPLIGLFFGYLSGLLVQKLAPEASGGGIPQVKASLANVPTNLSWRVAAVKLLSSIIALGSGITLGRQGPTVHIGAALAAGMSRWVPTSPDHRRQMIAAGAGAGLSAAFNAPIAGMIFVVEELLQDLSGLTLGTAIIASFIGGVVSRLLGGRSLQLDLEATHYSSSFSILELPFYLILGILAGLLAGLFNRGLLTSLKIYRRWHISLPLKVALAGLVSGVVIALLPESFRNNTGLREFVITGENINLSLAVFAFLVQFILTLVAFGSGAPGGLFAPSLILGSCLGYIIGICQSYLLGEGNPTTYALAGMGAFFSGVSKVPITAIVIVFEMTTDFNLVLPLMIGSVTSYLIADKIIPGSLYDKLLQLNGVKIQKQAPVEELLTQLKAKDVMQRRVETLEPEMSLDEVVEAFSSSHHRGFPVVDDGKLTGIVTQSDLLKIRDRKLAKEALLREIMTCNPLTVTPNHNLSNVLYMLNRYQISRLPVVEGHRLIGIITRADIIRAEADHLNAESRLSGPRPEPSYVVYQTRSPSIGRGRILVPIANPETAATLLEMAGAIARDRHYEIECVQIMVVSHHISPSETPVRTTKSRRLLRLAEALGKKWNIPVHTQIRVAHDISQTILETIKERDINLILMGWKGNTSSPGRIFGNVVDTIIRQATCDVMVVKLGMAVDISATSVATFNRWLVPMSGGPNVSVAIKLLPALVTLGSHPKIRLTRVFKPSEVEPDMTILEEAIRQLIRRRKFVSTVFAAPVKAESVSEGVINLVNKERYDVVVLGASREGMLQQALKGNIPETIASGVDSTVILVRGAL